MANEVLILSDRDVRQCLDRMGMPQAIELVEGVLRAHAEGRAIMPAKLHMELAPLGVESWMNAMPAYLAPGDLMGLKWIGGFGGNPAAGRPYIVGLIVLVEARTGALVAVMDGTQITSVRTGASAGVAARCLAPEGPATVALIGAGVQGESALDALRCTLDIREVRIADANARKAAALTARFAGRAGTHAAVAPTVAQAVRDAQVVVTATPADEPLVRQAWLAPGALVLTLGSYREVDDAVFTLADKIVVDNWEQAQHRGSLKEPVEHGLVARESLWGELPDIVDGKLAGRQRGDEHIVCCEVGMGSQDLALACRVHQMAREAGLGTRAPFTCPA